MKVPILPLPISKEIYEQLPMSLKLLAFHCTPEDESAFAAYLKGEYMNVSTKANMLWFQDYTGLPEIVNLAAKREALANLGKDPKVIKAQVPTHMVFDHSVRTMGTIAENMDDELRLNRGRIRMAKWAAKQMGIKVVPPGKGVIHQINFEKMVPVFNSEGRPVFGKGTDSHSPMVNGLGILAWGIGGSEAQLVFNGERVGMKIPKVIAINLSGELWPGVSSSDFAFYLKKVMRDIGVTGAFVEVIGKGVDTLPVAARGTIANIAAEFGSRTVLFGIDNQTVDFLALSGRHHGVRYRAIKYGIWRTRKNEKKVHHTKVVNVNLSEVQRGINGPDEPHLWNPLEKAGAHVKNVFVTKGVDQTKVFHVDGVEEPIPNGALLLASIASCTHTANPDSIIRAAIFAKKAARYGFQVKPWVKTAFASGSLVADIYLKKMGLIKYLEEMGFGISAHGCGACIGQSGGLNEIGNDLIKQGMVPTSIVSANRNYAGRQDANVSISFLGAPDMIIAYAIVGRMDVDITTHDFGGGITLENLVANEGEVADAMKYMNKGMHTMAYTNLFKGSKEYQSIDTPNSPLYDWPDDVLVKRPPFFVGMKPDPDQVSGINGARILGIFGNNFSTDAISPAGEPIQIPAVMDYLASQGVTNFRDVLSLGGYRSNDNVVAAGTFGNPTNQNLMVPGKKGGWTVYFPDGELMSIYNAAKKYREAGIPQVIIGGINYGCGSSRVMAASGPWMLGVKTIIAQSFEAIHRSNLWQNGIVPLCFPAGENAETLSLIGDETWDIPLDEISSATKNIQATLTRTNGETMNITLTAMLESEQELEFLQHGGAMQKQLREFAQTAA